jgi:very-short-patch-repair endonuclease
VSRRDLSVPAAAGGQAGVFTAAQARKEGWTDRQIRRRTTSGAWVGVAGRALAAVQDEPWSPHQLAVAGQLTEPALTTSHITAALLHGFPVEPDGLSHLTGRPVHRSHRGLVVHRLPLDATDVIALDGWLMVTDPARTAVDCLAAMSLGPGLDLWAFVSTRRILTVDALRRLVLERRGRWGTPRLRDLLDLVQHGAVSRAEYVFHQLLREAGITGWIANAEVQDDAGRVGVVDVLFADARVVVEIDGRRAHSGRQAFVQDRRRQNRLVNAGYIVLRFTWQDLVERPAAVLRELRKALARAAFAQD